ncbi:succinylglutamate desuccinylase/aspartoacylase family protein [Olivibacter sp. SDN3]|uniref:succinylglutamate desuccinylase/aspartoacylase family protein n=1 Tax=Olivibacter sp. SDN3 TaxID=2764720 RepID=UPI001C9E5798|nr:succinylglutamate desuccinylase/aspartoacylase family protein [Olivibacter sp. SDN3]
MSQSFDFYKHQVKPGQRVDLQIPVSDEKHRTFIPISILHGKQPGPTFSIIAGVHGYEYTPILAVQQLLAQLDPEKLSGTLLIVPVANVPGFEGRSVFINPQDRKNLNRVFPGDLAGSITERIAATINQYIIKRSDILLDIHAGDGNEDLLPFACYYDRKDTPGITAHAKSLTLAAGFTYNLSYPYTLKPHDKAEYAFKEATQQGLVALSLECGKLGRTDSSDTDQIVHAILNILHKEKMLPGKHNNTTLTPQKLITKQHYVYAPTSGIFYSNFKSGDLVEKGKMIGYISDFFGKVQKKIHAPVKGRVMYKIGTPPVQAKETVFCIGEGEEIL